MLSEVGASNFSQGEALHYRLDAREPSTQRIRLFVPTL